MHKNIKWGNKELPGVSWDDLNKITARSTAVAEAKYAINDFLALKPDLVAKLAEPFTNPWQMIDFKGENEKQINAAGRLIDNEKIPRPEWFISKDDYQKRYANIDWKKARAKGNANTDWKARTAKRDYKTERAKGAANTDYKARKTDYKAIALKKQKPVSQYDKNGNFIKDWDSITQIEIELNYGKGSGVGQCCRGKQKSAKGFIWKFKE